MYQRHHTLSLRLSFFLSLRVSLPPPPPPPLSLSLHLFIYLSLLFSTFLPPCPLSHYFIMSFPSLDTWLLLFLFFHTPWNLKVHLTIFSNSFFIFSSLSPSPFLVYTGCTLQSLSRTAVKWCLWRLQTKESVHPTLQTSSTGVWMLLWVMLTRN